jgi:hypothetical protein
MNVFATGPRGIVATLDSNGNLLRVLRGTLRRTQLTVAVPSITVGSGTAALSKVDLAISGGSGRRPTFTTPATVNEQNLGCWASQRSVSARGAAGR